MRKYFILMLILFVVFVITKTEAQQSSKDELSKPEKEETVKLTGDYYWEEAKAKTKEEAKEMAREFLIEKIIKDHNFSYNVKSILLKDVEYLLYMRGPKYRIVAFIDKNNISEDWEKRKKFHVVEIKHTDKYDEEPNADEKIVEKNTNDEPIIEDEVNTKEIIKTTEEIVDRDEINTIEDTNTTNEELSETELAEKLEDNMNPENKVEEIEYKKLQEFEPIESDDLELLNLYNRKQLATITNAKELLTLLNKLKAKGKLVFGNKQAFIDNPDICDIAIINPTTKKVLAYLIQKNNTFLNFKTNTIIKDFSTTFKGTVAIWIQNL